MEKQLSAPAERMRLHRIRKRAGYRCVTIELRATEVEALVHRRFLDSDKISDLNAIRKALYMFLDRTIASASLRVTGQ